MTGLTALDRTTSAPSDDPEIAAIAREFDQRGCIGPFPALTPEEIGELKDAIPAETEAFADRAPYPRANSIKLDQHLHVPSLLSLVTNPEVVKRLRGAIGNDILCWRSSWFPKTPGDPGTDWHQAEKFHEFSGTPKLAPTQPCEFFELTAWVAFTECTVPNGCLQIVPGTHREWFFKEDQYIPFQNEAPKIKAGEARSFYGYDTDHAKIEKKWSPDPDRIVDLVMQPGEVIIFTSRCLHGSRPNITNDSVRLGLGMRYCAAHVKVYEGLEKFAFFNEEFSTANHRSVLVSGEATWPGNKVIKAADLRRDLLL